MFGFKRIAYLEVVLSSQVKTIDSLTRRMKLLEKKLGVTYSEGTKKKPHYKVAGKVGRPKGSKTRNHGEV